LHSGTYTRSNLFAMYLLRSRHLSIFFLGLFLWSFSPASAVEEKLNFTDAQGRRQGYWKITGQMTFAKNFAPNQTIEEGHYVDNKRVGIWKKYYPSGELRSEINYENNHPRGEYRIFYPNGNLEEEGTWKGNRNSGSFVRYHENGTIAQKFFFLDNGKRNGVQKYYYDNGELQLSVEVENGVANGRYLSYYEDGALKSEKTVVNGKVDPDSVTEYPPQKEYFAMTDMPDIPEDISGEGQDTQRADIGTFNRSGYNTLYNRNKQVTQVGEFKKGRLWNGKWHRYDAEGNLKRTEVYKEGKFIGYGHIADADN